MTCLHAKGCRKKSTKVHATRPKCGLGIRWNFAYWPGMYKFVFLNVENLCFLSGGLYLQLYFYCRMSLSEGNSSKIQRG